MTVPSTTTIDFKLTHNPEGRLTLTDATGIEHVGVSVVRAFPISDPGRSISICDSRGREIVSIDSLASLPHEMRELIEAEAARRQFMPVIQRILNDPRRTEPTQWEVETDRGASTIRIEHESDIRRYQEHGVLVVDSHGIHFQILDLRQLDAHSRRVLDRLL